MFNFSDFSKNDTLKGLAVFVTITVGTVTLISLYHRIQIDRIQLAKLRKEQVA